MVIDFNRPGGSPSAGGAGRSSSTQAQERTGTSKSAGTVGTPDLTTDTPTESTAVAAQTTGENVQLSPEAQHLQRAEERLRDTPDTDSARIERLRQSIADGTYQIDSKRLAAKIVAFESQTQ